MIRSFASRWLRRGFAGFGFQNTRQRRKPSRPLTIEQLETRVVPIVGSNSFATEVLPGGLYDGVARLGNGGSATLLSSGRHLLTSASAVDVNGDRIVDGSQFVEFELTRGAGTVFVSTLVPASSITLDPLWDGDPTNGNNLAILRLTDFATNGHLIAPFSAQRYDVFPIAPTNQVITMVGHGATGTMDNGREDDEVQSVVARSGVSTFRLLYHTPFGDEVTGDIPSTASAETVAAALESLPSIGFRGVAVWETGLGSWNVRFVDQNGSQDVEQLFGDGADVGTAINGDSFGSFGVKRSGNNLYFGSAVGTLLSYDFMSMDDFSIDIGAPSFVDVSGTPFLAGVWSYSTSPGFPQDATGYRFSNFTNFSDGSVGETSTDTLALPRLASFITPQISGTPYPLVLDMNVQVLGRDFLTEDLTITATRVGTDLVLQVTNDTSPGVGEGTITVPLADVSSLTIRGSSDRETIVLDPTLGIPVTVDGRSGFDVLDLTAFTSQTIQLTGTGSFDGFNGNNGGQVALESVDAIDAGTGINELRGADLDATWAVNATNVGTYTDHLLARTLSFTSFQNLTGGSANDTFRFLSGGSVTGTVAGGSGTNTLDYSFLDTPVVVNLGLGTTGLTAALEGDQEVPPRTTTPAAGTVAITNYNVTAKTFDVSVTVTDLDPALVTGFHLHRAPFGVNGPIIVDFLPLGPLVPSGTGFTFTATGVALPAIHEAAFLGGITYVNVHTSAAPTGLIRGQAFSLGNVNLANGTATATAGITGIQEVIGGFGADSLVGSFAANGLQGLAGNDTLVGAPGADTMLGGAGDDVMVWSNGDGSDFVEGGTGFDTTQVNGALGGGALNDSFTILPGPEGRIDFDRVSTGPFGLDIGTTETLTVNGIEGNDTFRLGDLSTVLDLTAVNLNGLAGTDTVIGPDLATTWSLLGRNRGNLVVGSFPANYTSVENLTGGGGGDRFAFFESPSMVGSIDGNLDGGSGFDQLDYSAVTVEVTTNLQTSTSTRIGGTFSNLEGGIGTADPTLCDVLVGENDANFWSIFGQNAGFVDGFSFESYESLTGGTDTDRFVFGPFGSVDCDVDGNGGSDTLDYTDLAPQAVLLTTAGPVDGFEGTDGSGPIGLSFFNIDDIRATQGSRLTGIDDTAIWVVDGLNEGSYFSALHALRFVGFAFLTGGSGDDLFQFADEGVLPGQVAGTINGGAGFNGLSYQAIAQPSRTNLAAGTATRITGTFANVGYVFGSATPGVCDELVGQNDANVWTIDGQDSGNVDGFFFFDVESLTGGSADDRFAFVDGASTQGSIGCNLDGGFGTDTLDYTGLLTVATTNLGTGQTSRVGTDPSHYFTNIEALDGSNLGQDLVPENVPNLWLIDGLNAGTVNGFRFANVPILQGGTDQDRFELLANGRITGSVNGNGDIDTLVGFDVANAWTIDGLNAGSLTATPTSFVTAFTGVENLTGGALADDFAFTAAGSITGDLDGGLGTDVLNYLTLATPTDTNLQTGKTTGVLIGTFANVERLFGGTSPDNRITGQDNANVWSIDHVNRGNVDGFSFTDIANLTGGNSTDRFVLTDTASMVTGSLVGGDGSVTDLDTLVAFDVFNTWAITRSNGGSLNATIPGGGSVPTFDSIESLVGGSRPDTFVFAASATAGIAGLVDGAGDRDTLDYQALSDAIDVNLQTGTADRLGTFANVEAILAGDSTGDTLTGKSVRNTWSITGTNEGRVGTIDFEGFENLTGGALRDVFQFVQVGAVIGRVTGVIDGGDALSTANHNDNWLDYHNLPIAVRIDLRSPLNPTARTGGVTNIDNVLGGALGYNILVGNSHDNILVSYRRGNELRGLDGKDLLVGGLLVPQVNPNTGRVETRKNYLFGGRGQDVIVPGATVYDTDVESLGAILARWTAPGTTASAQVFNLLPPASGVANGPVFASDRTVFVNSVTPSPLPNGQKLFTFEQSIVHGGAGFDFVVAGYAAIIRDIQPGEEWNRYQAAFTRMVVLPS